MSLVLTSILADENISSPIFATFRYPPPGCKDGALGDLTGSPVAVQNRVGMLSRPSPPVVGQPCSPTSRVFHSWVEDNIYLKRRVIRRVKGRGKEGGTEEA